MSLERRCKNLIVELNLGSPGDVKAVTPLAGGISSDIALVELKNRKICVKFALEQLKVPEKWYAAVKRNRAEYLWLEFVSSIAPESTPALFGCSEAANGFAMEYLEGGAVYLWKDALLAGRPAQGEAAGTGDLLGLIHQVSSTAGIADRFQNQDDFHSLRLEPYLEFTAGRHAELSDELIGLVESLEAHRPVLVHGDVSPKNIMFRNGAPIFLDAECAVMGDPCFDIAFCLNHLIIKAIHFSDGREALFRSVLEFMDAYRPHVTWEPPERTELRTCGLLPGLMLARIDGKSPVEYLDEAERGVVRSMAVSLLSDRETSLADLIGRIKLMLEKN